MTIDQKRIFISQTFCGAGRVVLGISSEEPSKRVTLNYPKGVHMIFVNPHDSTLQLLILKGGL